MHEPMGNDWMSVHYTMKTSAPQRPSPGPRSSHARTHSRSGSFSKRSAKSPSSSTPVASPRMPYSVGQMHPPPPRLSPGRPSGTRSPSPNYFGMVPEADGNSRESSNLPRDHWDPPTSSVRSFGEVLPQHMPIEANPDYEAFRKQIEQNRGVSGFNLPTSQHSPAITQAASLRPRPPPRWHTHSNESMSISNAAHRPALNRNKSGTYMDVDPDTTQNFAYVSPDSKRNPEASMQPPAKPPMFLNMPTFESPRPTGSPFDQRAAVSKLDERHPRLSVPQSMADGTYSQGPQGFHPKAETMPAKMEGGPSMIPPSQLKELIESSESDTDLLLLDLRVSQQYLQARIDGALNLCTPTTLLKRATFNLQKLKQTFSNPEDKAQFSKWASTHNLVVYDSHSVEKRDALPCVNMVKKFTNEGYKGSTFILRGGFNAFYEAYPELVDEGWAAGSDGTSHSTNPADGPRAGLPPVIGGVMLPAASNEPNPFFSNIRQNMDLADGVGQLDISRPKGLDSPSLPRWLRDASTAKDEGKQVSEKFLSIEKDEQSRMKEAYSMFKPTANPPSNGLQPVQLCGVEKGGKNRYKDILPFEHARVKLQGRPRESCDYVNASHIKGSGSNKRYIASQGPLPATFEDFWSMIWDQDVRVIVMLTAESEGGTLKCHPYWKGRDFGPIRLKPLSEKKVSLDMEKHRSHSQASMFSSASASELGRKRANTTTTLGDSGNSPALQPLQSQNESHVIIRKFALSHASQPFAPIREITHLHYPSWPDFGAPAQPSHLLALVELANVMQRASLPVDTPLIAASSSSPDPGPAWYDEPESGPRARPMLVHCSAGCGRTGTFCTVDSVIDMLKRQRLARTTLKPVRKRDSDGDIKMSGEREVEEPISPRTAQDRAFALSESPPNRSSSVNSNRRVHSWEEAVSPLDTSWVGDDGVDLVAKTVEDFRTQRLSMVQSLRQFVLCYESVLEYIARTHERSSANVSTSTGRARSGSLQVRRES